MKRRIVTGLAILLVPLAVLAAAGLVTSRQLLKTNASTTVPARLAARGTYATSITVIGKKSWRVDNTSTAYIGPVATNDMQPVAILPGQTVTLGFSADQFIDLYDWYLDVSTGDDGVVILYSR